MTAQAINARCEFISDLKQGDYGEYQSVLFINTAHPNPNSEEAKIWINRKPHELGGIDVGKNYLIVESGKTKTGKPKYTISFLEGLAPMSETSPIYTATSAAPVHTEATLNNAKKKEMIATIEQYAKVWKFCLETATKTIEEDVFPAVVAQCASDLFNAALSKHKL